MVRSGPTAAADGVAASVVWSPSLLGYRHSADHPMSPRRLDLTMSLATSLGVLDGVELVDPGVATDDELMRVHSYRYLEAVRAAGELSPGEHDGLGHGLGTADNPTFHGMHEASAAVAGGTLRAARAIVDGAATRAVSVAGGMHHAMPGSAAGFCVYNDVSVSIAWLLDHGVKRIAYVDVDVHHGDGVQTAFLDDPRVMTISLHQHPATLWPSTGWASETGVGRAEGSVVNVPLLPGVTDALWLRAFHAVVPGALRAFRPELIVLQGGCDSHREDPLADLSLTVDGQRSAYLAVTALADELCGGAMIAVGGGGYELVRVVPRAWTHLMAAVLGAPVQPSPPVPEDWRAMAARMAGPRGVPQGMGDLEGVGTGGDGTVPYTPWEPEGSVRSADDADDRALARLDQSVLDVRRAVFPLLGLDPDDPRD